MEGASRDGPAAFWAALLPSSAARDEGVAVGVVLEDLT